MSNLLLLLPFVGGYFFLYIFYLTTYRARRLAGHRLLFETAAAGLLLTALSRALAHRIVNSSPELYSAWLEISDGIPLLGTGMLTVLLAPTIAWSLNIGLSLWKGLGDPFPPAQESVHAKIRRYSTKAKTWALKKATHWSGDRLQILLHDAATRISEDDTLVLLSMKDRKLYVGKVDSLPSLRIDQQYISIVPFMSGHRLSEKLLPDFTLLYPTAYLTREELAEQLEGFNSDDLRVVLPVSEIQSARLFDMEVYKKFFLEEVLQSLYSGT